MNNTTHQTATALEAAFRAEGFTPGAPPHVSADCLAIDRRVCRQSRCPACRKRGLAFRPYHCGQRYRGLAVCSCGAGEEI
jgi:hypothetical protein